MHKLSAVALLLTALAINGGQMNALISRAVSACRSDAHRFCAEFLKDGKLPTALCLQTHSGEISSSCRLALLALVEQGL